MTRRVATRVSGFTVIELLIALTVAMLLAGAMANAVPSARLAFDRIPAELDLQQRGRTAIDAISQVLRSAGKDVAATTALGPLANLLPAVSVSNPGESGEQFSTLNVIVPVADGAQGVLVADQLGASLTLATDLCPSVRDVCGFTVGTTAVIADGTGRYDIFVVGLSDAVTRTLTADRLFAQPYPAGSVLVEIDRFTYRLAAQPGGSLSLIRETAAGAIQPVVDFVRDLSFSVTANRVDVSLRVEASTAALQRSVAARVFRTSIQLRNAS